MYINTHTSSSKIKGINMIFNFDNGVVAGIDARGATFFNEIKKGKAVERDLLTEEEKVFLDFLLDNEFISYAPLKKKEQVMTAYLHLTNQCNLHCVGCYSFDDKRNSADDMNYEEICHSIKQLASAGIQNLVFSGGEPLLRNDLLDIVRYAKINCGLPNIVLITNGTIYNKEKLAGLSRYVDTVSVSVDSYAEDCPSFIRDEGIFKKIIRTINYLKETGSNVNILPTVHHLNAHKLSEYVSLADKLGVTMSFSILTACFEGEMKSYLPQAEDIQKISDFMLDTDLAIEDTSIGGEQLQAENYCGAGKTMISIGTDGNVYPCHMLMYDEFCIGNIKSDTVTNMRKLSEKAQLFSSLQVDKLNGGCKECQFKYLCGGGCRARAYLKHEDILAKDPYCNLFYNYYEETTKTFR
ncbi:radical SAM protein [Enterococcus sp. AZ192]|uniref:radical SAM protein n=1 Tax=unclassified Enterococcus TaxID=2608891 RepID=UPI003D29E1A5